MLFLVYHEHTTENCPGKMDDYKENFLDRIDKDMRDANIKFIEAYIDPAGHRSYLILEADNVAKINYAIRQLTNIGYVNIIPVMTLSELTEWSSKID
jgi:hypothetical protein